MTHFLFRVALVGIDRSFVGCASSASAAEGDKGGDGNSRSIQALLIVCEGVGNDIMLEKAYYMDLNCGESRWLATRKRWIIKGP